MPSRVPWGILTAFVLPLSEAFPVATTSSCTGRDVVWRQCPSTSACGECTPVNCAFDAWTAWSGGDCTGVCERHRRIKLRNNECGTPCSGSVVETKECAVICDPSKSVDCVLSDWSEWTTCADKMQKYRRRSIVDVPTEGGTACTDMLSETAPCEAPKFGNAVISPWTEWSECDAKCGEGERVRTRKVLTEAELGGTSFTGDLKEVEGCPDLLPCADHIDCAWSDWQDWSGCSCTCGGGSKTRDRYIATSPRGQGRLCAPVDKRQITACNTQPCGRACVDGSWEIWSDWGACTATCVGGVTWRARKVAVQASECGKPPVGFATEYKTCGEGVSCSNSDIDCKFAEWAPWSDCSCTCDGWKERTRGMAVQGRGRGKFCVGPQNEIDACNVKAPGCGTEPRSTKVDCLLSDWTGWSTCSATCGLGQQSRTRSVATETQGDGKVCAGPVKEIATCDVGVCGGYSTAIPCQWDDWNTWGACTKCSGQKHRYRDVKHHAARGGAPCEFGASFETRACPRECHSKRTFCRWKDWDSWSLCAVSCGSGLRKRSRELTVASKATGYAAELPPEVLSHLEVVGASRTQDIVLSFTCGFMSLLFVMGAVRFFRTTREDSSRERMIIAS